MKIRMKSFAWKLREAVRPALILLSLAGVFVGIGYALCPAAMMGGEVVTAASRIGWFISRTAGAVYDNRGFVFAVSAGYFFSEKKLAGALAGLISILIYNAYSGPAFFSVFLPSVFDSPVSTLALYGPNAVTGIILGGISAALVNKLLSDRHPLYSAAAAGFILTAVTGILIAVRIILFHMITSLGPVLSENGAAGAAAYAFLNRLFSPFELHRPLNYVLLSEAGTGDMSRFWAQVTDGDPGRYMSGFFPPMMFGIPAACLYLSHRTNSRVFRWFILLTAVCAFSCGLAEPFEYWLILLCPAGYFCYALIYGISSWLAVITGFRAGFACSGGFIDLLFSAAMPAAPKTWILLPLGAVCAILFLVLASRLGSAAAGDSDIIGPGRNGEEES